MHETKRMLRLRKGLALWLAVILAIALTGCGDGGYDSAKELAKPASSSSDSGLEKLEINDVFEKSYLNFAIEMFQITHRMKSESMAVSPLSVMFALGMAENGASGETLAQMEEQFGFSRDAMNRYLATLISDVNGKKGLKIADSVWLRDSIADSVKKEFLQICANAYRASVFKAPFDETTVSDINHWIDVQTDGMIPEMLHGIDKSCQLILVNAVLFDQKWEEPFEKDDTENGAAFYDAAGNLMGTVDLMTQKFSDNYYRDELCTVVDKEYEQSGFSFWIYQPQEGVTVNELIAAMTPEYLMGMRSYGKRHDAKITLKLPRFTTEYECDKIADVLKEMGFTKPFANGFDSMTDELVRLDEVLHKTRVEVDEEGTKAAAVTIMETKSAAPMEHPNEILVRLDHPFVYSINYDGIPVFFGTYEGQ